MHICLSCVGCETGQPDKAWEITRLLKVTLIKLKLWFVLGNKNLIEYFLSTFKNCGCTGKMD